MRTVNLPRTRRGRVVAASLLGLALTSGEIGRAHV